MAVRLVEGQVPYSGGTGIEISTGKVISVLLRSEDNLIKVNDDNELYTDLQIESGIAPTDDFETGVTVGTVLEADGWEQSGLILNWQTTSGDYARWIYANDGELYFDCGDGTWRQVYYGSEVDSLLSDLRDEIDEYYMRRDDFEWQDKSGAVNITLELSTTYTPTADFIVNAPSTIEEGQTYLLRVNNTSTVYTMTLGNNVINRQSADTTLTASKTDMFVFLGIDGVLELQKEIPSGSTANDGTLTIQKNSTTVATFTANQSTNTTANIEVPEVIDNLTSTSTTDALSAYQGYVLKALIDDMAGLGRFLSLRDCSTGLPISFPLSTPYTYNTGDYFIVETIDGTTDYRPTGSSYSGTASTTQETDEVEVGDVYVYDGSVWLLQSNHGKTASFANIAGQPTDNTNLATALAAKQDVLTAGSNISISNNVISATNTTYSTATSTTAGIVALGNDTVITDSINTPGTTTGKTYPVQLNSSGQMGVNVPRTNTTYSAGTNVTIDANNAISATDTTYTAGTGLSLSGTTFSADTTVVQPKISTLSLTLAAASRSNNTITVTASGVTSSNSIIVSPDPSSITDWGDCMIYCSAQGTNTLTFTCSTTPTSAITANVLIIN